MVEASGEPVRDTAQNSGTNALQNGSAASTAQQQYAQSPEHLSPFAAQDGWARAKEAVKRNVGVSSAFKTLRDLNSIVIQPKQLNTLKVLGQGAFATVEAAMYNPAGGGKPYMVAVKRLKMELFRNQEDLDMFVHEVELMRKLRHSNIVDFVGAGEVRAGDVPGAFACEFIVQEYMPGGTLKQLITREMLGNGRRTYTNEQALDICLQMARGLRYLHKCSPMIIHRDLKCENVLLRSTIPVDGKFVVKLCDFGLSRRVQAKHQAIALRKTHSSIRALGSLPVPPTRMLTPVSTPNPSLQKPRSNAMDELETAWSQKTKSSFVSKTPPAKISSNQSEPQLSFSAEQDETFQLTGRTGSLMYMAPEVYKELPYSEKADVFSFGIIMYEVLQRYIVLSAVAVAGTYEELESYCGRVAGGYRPPLHSKWPSSVAKLIQDCWAQSPLARPSMDEVVTRLEHIQLSGEMSALDKAEPKCGCTIC